MPHVHAVRHRLREPVERVDGTVGAAGDPAAPVDGHAVLVRQDIHTKLASY
ncbi:hypothetical protein HZZ00_17965 [Streptomyces sp. NEAU-sy36]|uniref:hypothetical protein n=1 Tax=unclassified Streptomyces TaxID=2593676 RepID=UPI0015D5F5EE|nr:MULTISPECIES: hypothetical protein [unclassified Streptomyces]QLJ02724.1 hypothetical protein HZZ00_17965 [Streptomyces sp. NEAU-sy36]